MLDVKNLTVQYGTRKILNSVSFTVEPGQWLMIIGPNGAGKSTIINAISQGAPYSGQILFQGKNIRQYKPKELAQKIGVLSQHHTVGYDFTVEEVIRLGRYAYAPSLFSRNRDDGADKIQEAVSKTGLEPFLKQSVLTLSGGELQRTFLAQLFAQDPNLLMLDEPTNHLDLIYQKQVFALIRDWLKGSGRAVVSVVHDLSLAKTYGTHAILLNKGKIFASGSISRVMEPENLNQVYGMDVPGWMREMYGQWLPREDEHENHL